MFIESLLFDKDFAGGSAVENPPANVGDVDSTPELGRSPGEGNATHCSILAWEIPWTEEPGGLQFMGLQRIGHYWATKHMHARVHTHTICQTLY